MHAPPRMVTSAARRMGKVVSAGNGSTWSKRLNPPLASNADTPEPIRFYGRRKGKPLKAGRLALLDTLLPKLQIARPTAALDPRALFPFTPDAVWLEIGFGGGEHLAAQAGAHRNIGFIGSEVFLNGVAGALKGIDAGQLD